MNPFLSVWLQPKQTACYIIQTKTTRYAISLVVVGSMALVPVVFQDSGAYPAIPYMWLLLSTFILAPLVGVLVYLISVALITFVGEILGGTGEFWTVGKALSISYIPQIVTWPVYILWLFVAPASFFIGEITDVYSLIGRVILLVTAIWSAVIIVRALAEAHKFSNARALAAILLPALVISAGLLAIIFIILAFFAASMISY